MPDRPSSLTIRQRHFVRRNLRMVYGQAHRYRRRERGRCPLTFEELVSDGTLALCDCARGYRPELGSPASYCTPAIARRMAHALRRAKLDRQRHRQEPPARAADDDPTSSLALADVPDDAEPPARAAPGVGRYMIDLTATERRVVEWSYGLGGSDRLSQEEMARRLGLPWRAVAGHLRLALAKMRERAAAVPLAEAA